MTLVSHLSGRIVIVKKPRLMLNINTEMERMYIGKVSVVINVTIRGEYRIKVILTDKKHFIVSCSFSSFVYFINPRLRVFFGLSCSAYFHKIVVCQPKEYLHRRLIPGCA